MDEEQEQKKKKKRQCGMWMMGYKTGHQLPEGSEDCLEADGHEFSEHWERKRNEQIDKERRRFSSRYLEMD